LRDDIVCIAAFMSRTQAQCAALFFVTAARAMFCPFDFLASVFAVKKRVMLGLRQSFGKAGEAGEQNRQ